MYAWKKVGVVLRNIHHYHQHAGSPLPSSWLSCDISSFFSLCHPKSRFFLLRIYHYINLFLHKASRTRFFRLLARPSSPFLCVTLLLETPQRSYHLLICICKTWIIIRVLTQIAEEAERLSLASSFEWINSLLAFWVTLKINVISVENLWNAVEERQRKKVNKINSLASVPSSSLRKVIPNRLKFFHMIANEIEQKAIQSFPSLWLLIALHSWQS